MYKNEKFSFKLMISVNGFTENLPVKTTTKYPLKKKKLLFLNWSNL